MSYPKILIVFAAAAFAGLGTYAYLRSGQGASVDRQEEDHTQVALTLEPLDTADCAVEESAEEPLAQPDLPDVNRMEEFFYTGLPQLPIVETIVYSSRVPWKKGSAAWVEDYARHYKTSKHFIARSLNGMRDYMKQDVANGDRFNVLKPDAAVSFHLVVDLSRAKMWVYYLDEERGERVLVSTYPVGLGRPDAKRASGFLTPKGTYTLGEKIAVYRPGSVGRYNGDKCEMVQVFGTRWIPFEEEIRECTAPAKGLGLHGCPWSRTPSGELVEDRSGLGKYESDGCVRLATEDMEELFAVIITRPSTVYLVDDFFDAQLPGKEL